ncbi:MAG TPA: hypothetical protein PLU17_06560 [Chitinophagaceae bacterium]|nr:hypothetical protein [Chitinophagaceae bacterium]
MGYFPSDDPQAYDSELYQRVWKRYVKLYPEASDSMFEPYYSGHDTDWDEFWEEEYQRLNEERANEAYGPAPPPKKEKKKKKKKKKKEETTDTVGGCSQQVEDEKAQYCNFTDIYFKANDGEDVFMGPHDEKFHTDFEVICGRTADKGKLRIELGGELKGPCADHVGSKTFYVYGNNMEIVEETDTSLELELNSHYKISNEFFEQLEVMLDVQPESLRIAMSRCGNQHEMKIWIYPKIEYKADINVKFKDWTTNSKVQAESDPSDKTKKWTEKKEKKVSITKSYNGETQKLNYTLEQKFDFDKLLKVVEKVTDFNKKYFGDLVNLTLVLPNITGSGAWSYRTDKEYNVYRNGSISIKADPLFGITLDISLLQAGLMATTGPAAKWILALPKKVAEWTNGRAELKFDVILSETGSIGFAVEQEFALSKSLSAIVECSIQLKLEITLSAKVDAYIFMVSASGSGSAAAKFSMSLSLTKLFLPEGNVRIGFDGLTITLLVAVEVGWFWTSYSDEIEKKWTPLEPDTFWVKKFNLNT